MSRVGCRCHEAGLQAARPVRRTSRSFKRFSRPAPIAEHIETAVPRRRQVHFDVDFGRNHQTDPAVLRSVCGSLDHGCANHREIERCEAAQLSARDGGLSGRARRRPVVELYAAGALAKQRGGAK